MKCPNCEGYPHLEYVGFDEDCGCDNWKCLDCECEFEGDHIYEVESEPEDHQDQFWSGADYFNSFD